MPDESVVLVLLISSALNACMAAKKHAEKPPAWKKLTSAVRRRQTRHHIDELGNGTSHSVTSENRFLHLVL